MPDQTFTVHPINQIHALWWDYYYFLSCHARMATAIGARQYLFNEKALVNYNKFRRFLLELHGRPDDKICEHLVADFMPPGSSQVAPRVSYMHDIPIVLAAWQRHSRCHYRPTMELWAVLRETSLEGLRWGDILHDQRLELRPYKSFSLQLPGDIGMLPGRNYNFITVTTREEPAVGQQLLIHAYDQRLQEYQPLTKAEIKQMEDRCTNRKHNTWFMGCYQRFLERSAGAMSWISLVLDINELRDQLVQDTAAAALAQRRVGHSETAIANHAPPEQEELDRIVRAVVGFCFYMDTIDSDSPKLNADRQPRYNGPVDRRRVITDESQVFDVASSIRLTDEERGEIGLDGYAVPQGRRALYNWHFRRGHTRRLPGQGNNPEAEKSVKVKAAIVRADLAITPGVPGGRIVEL